MIHVTIAQLRQSGFYDLVYQGTVFPSHEGWITLWDLETGTTPGLPHYGGGYMYKYFSYPDFNVHFFMANVLIESCQGPVYPYYSCFEVITMNSKSGKTTDDDMEMDADMETSLKELILEEILKGDIVSGYAVHEEGNMVFPVKGDGGSPADEIMIYPNPNQGSFAVISHNPDNPIQKVEIYTTLGQLLGVIEKDFHAIRLASHIQGTLFLRITTANESVIKKMVVQ